MQIVKPRKYELIPRPHFWFMWIRDDELYVDYNIFKNKDNIKRKKLESLPASCWESAECLLAQRRYFEKDGVFPAGVIDDVVSKLQAFDDKGLSEKLYNRNEEISKLIRKFIHCS